MGVRQSRLGDPKKNLRWPTSRQRSAPSSAGRAATSPSSRSPSPASKASAEKPPPTAPRKAPPAPAARRCRQSPRPSRPTGSLELRLRVSPSRSPTSRRPANHRRRLGDSGLFECTCREKLSCNSGVCLETTTANEIPFVGLKLLSLKTSMMLRWWLMCCEHTRHARRQLSNERKTMREQ